MKKFITLIIAAVAFFAASSAKAQILNGLSKNEFKELVASMDDTCPMDLGDGMSITSIKFSDSYLTFKFRCNEDDETIQILDMMSESMGPVFTQMFGQDPDTAVLIAYCKAHRISLRFTISNRRGTTANIVVKYTDL